MVDVVDRNKEGRIIIGWLVLKLIIKQKNTFSRHLKQATAVSNFEEFKTDGLWRSMR